MQVMSKLLDTSCDDVFVAYSQSWVMHASTNRRASTLIDAMVGTLVALDLRGRMENTNAGPKMCWWCAVIMVGSTLLLF